MTSTVRYFGYGANKTPEMMEAMVGRVPMGVPAVLEDFELCIQEWLEIPSNVREILFRCGWDPSFKTYCARRAKGKKVNGMLWVLTPEEHALVGNWEMHGQWFEPLRVVVKDEQGTAFDVLTEIMQGHSMTPALEVYGASPPPFPVDEGKFSKLP
ncbi:MAG TPA: gamma-glutamylcyclotransferase family protein [Candidatus Nanoarchaeia archaeon]|nr:gamma-glutamylcyclotransferase family protein [Candidatus Nanoarchaeia archaeon]